MTTYDIGKHYGGDLLTEARRSVEAMREAVVALRDASDDLTAFNVTARRTAEALSSAADYLEGAAEVVAACLPGGGDVLS